MLGGRACQGIARVRVGDDEMPAPAPGKIVTVGAGIAGLCTAVYARRCGCDVEVVEQHETAGGLATSWRRGDYTFETCLHWLVGTRVNGALHGHWREVFGFQRVEFLPPG